MGIRGKPPILGVLVIERFRSFPAGGHISLSCCGNKISCCGCVILLRGSPNYIVTWLLSHISKSDDLLSMRSLFVIMIFTLMVAPLEDVKLLSELSFEVSVQFLNFKYMPSVLLIQPKGEKYLRKPANLFVEEN